MVHLFILVFRANDSLLIIGLVVGEAKDMLRWVHERFCIRENPVSFQPRS